MDSDEVSGEEYAEANNEAEPFDADDATWPEPGPVSIKWAVHRDLGIILLTPEAKPDPGDSKTNKLLQQLIDKLDKAIGILTLIHRGIK